MVLLGGVLVLQRRDVKGAEKGKNNSRLREADPFLSTKKAGNWMVALEVSENKRI